LAVFLWWPKDMSDPNKGEKKKAPPAGGNPNGLPFNVRLSYSPDPAEEDAYLAYQECMIEMEERRMAAEAARNANGQEMPDMNSLNFQTPSPNLRDSAFVPLTQPPVMRPPNPHSSFYRTSSAVPASQMNALFNPYGMATASTSSEVASGRRSAPPMLPSPPSGVPNNRFNEAPVAAAASLPPRNNNLAARTAAGNAAAKRAAAAAAKRAQAPANKKKKGAQGAGGGSMHYRAEELEALMEIMDDVVPIGKYEKEKVCQRYNDMFPTRPREYQNLMSQFNKYASRKEPTGDPDCPPLVRKAKRICQKIKDKAGIACMNEEEEEEEEEDVEDEDDALAENAARKRTATKVSVVAEEDDRKPAAAPRATKKAKKEETSKSIMEMYMASELAASRRAEALQAQRHEERQQMLQLGIGVLQSLASAFFGRVNPGATDEPAPARALMGPESDNSTTSSEMSVRSTLKKVYHKTKGRKSFNHRLADWKKANAKKHKKRIENSKPIKIMCVETEEEDVLIDEEEAEEPNNKSTDDDSDDGGGKPAAI
jgi:hypothetical protein